MASDYRFSTDSAELDRSRVHRWISEESYWAPGRSRAKQDAAIDGSQNFGVYDVESGGQVAYARAITDRVTFAWLCDVFVDGQVRGRGVGALLIAGIVDYFEPLGLRRIALSTNDAHGLYAKFGFEALTGPDTWMERIGDLNA
ncbi:GNAT family N-acetyltransferase [Leifsonia shinshuensis]|uniref:GNAT family N-acetyltransferase n=1 Tax=Leifsonia shinshuensis TaxID=150026 RepID=A0A7G6YFR8_9MICO|nr:GNAT family N-acetyltransferase [Leifsonia shinshuensis]QNE37333.1 GNAT family N-acetyltransferase [Leifsonia shinshuensis]